MFSLKQRCAVVTGGAQGIGKAFAEALLEAGCKVAILDCNKNLGEKTALELSKIGPEVIFKFLDVSHTSTIKTVLNDLRFYWGKIDIALNNVGIGANSAAEKTAEMEWKNIIDVNLNALFFFAQSVGKLMLQQGSGVIVNTASMSSVIIPRPQKQAAYNSAKAAVVQLTKSLAVEWGGRGVRVNCISPGIVDTPLINTEALRDLKSQWVAQNPMGRLANVEDLKGSIVYLVSDAARYVNGHNLIVDGGHSL